MTAAGAACIGAALDFLGRFFLPSPFPMYQNVVWGRRRPNIDDASIVSVDTEVVNEEANEKHCCNGIDRLADDELLC